MFRKTLDDEMLVTHLPADAKDKSGRVTPPETASAHAAIADPKALAAQLSATTDPEERKKLIAEIQERLGNQEAERIVAAIRKSEEK